MKKTFLISLFLAIFIVSCSSSDRGPTSVKNNEDTAHEQYQGYFNKPDQ